MNGYAFSVIDGGRRRRDSCRSLMRGRFVFQVSGDATVRYETAASEWHLFHALRRISADGGQLVFFESAECPLTPRSLAALNAYLRSGAMRFFRSRRFDYSDRRELLGLPEWRRFCRMLALRFDGRRTQAAA